MERLQVAEAAREKAEFRNKIQRNPFGQAVSNNIATLHFHFIGDDKNRLLRHVFIVICIQIAGLYINKNYLAMSPLFVQPIVFVLTLYVLYLKSKKKLRQEFEEQFSEALNIINSSIRAGNSVIQGIEQCGEKIHGTLGKEFKNISQRLEIGEDISRVFMDSWEKLPFHEYYFFIITVQINMKGGGQVREVMSRLGKLISNARIMEKKKYAMTSEARMSVKILACIPLLFLLFLKFQAPESMEILLHHPIGQILLYYAAGSILLGLLIVWSMMNKV
ncbi:type II secretion system F family protein [Enterobacteriaceae bacterium ESL0689]|nr:type II secretion system F family protein [Enterobacteriaceae bacterium ESL0689]